MHVDARPLCAACRESNVLPHLLSFLEKQGREPSAENETSYEYSVPLPELAKSSLNGCPWCVKVLGSFDQAIPASKFQDQDDVIQVALSFRQDTGAHGTGLWEARADTMYQRGDELKCGVLIADIKTLDKPHLSPLLGAQSAPFDGDFSACKTWASQVLNGCVSSHLQCSTPEYGSLPTRVIDVLAEDIDDGSSSAGDVRIHISVPDVKEKYVALSYCWGGSQNLLLTAQSLAAFTHRIAYQNLPLTIRDAVYFTRLLGVRYLWVDALCILQDSREDKRREIRNMRQIYKNAYFTIVASQARTVYEGFLPRSRMIQALEPSPERPEVVCLKFLRWYFYAYGEPTTKRAWTLEERLLPQRLFVFMCMGLIFTCHNGQQGFNLDENDKKELAELDTGSARLSLTPLTDASQPVEGEGISDFWCKIVSDYGMRRLTKPGDKLLAIAGVAAEFAATRRLELGTYMAGVWSKHAMAGLMWKIDVVPERSSSPSIYRAPSWSWAAIDGFVEFVAILPEKRYQTVAHVVGFDVQREDDDADEFIGVLKTGSSVTIRAPSLDVTLRGKASPDDEPRGWSASLVRADENSASSSWVANVALDTSEPFSTDGIQAKALVLQHQEDGPIHLKRSEGLVLVPARDSVFRRVGWFVGCRFDEAGEAPSDLERAETQNVVIV